MASCKIMWEGQEAGRLHFAQSEKSDYVFSARCPFEEGMIYRAFAAIDDVVTPLGVMQPDENKSFVLRKRVRLKDRGNLENSNVSAYIVKTPLGQDYTETIPKSQGSGPLADRFLRRIFEKSGNGKIVETPTGFCLTFPLKKEEDSPFAPFFWATRLIESGGEIVLKKDGSICTKE